MSPGEELPPETLDKLEQVYYNPNVQWALIVRVAWKPQVGQITAKHGRTFPTEHWAFRQSIRGPGKMFTVEQRS